jgi:predicted MFS family arabinose efflux permease
MVGNMKNQSWDSSYEWKAVTLLTLGFGLVGLDRWIIAPLLPSMSRDLHLNYQDAGNIVAALGLSWGVFAIIGGGLSDRIGRKKVLIPAMVAFSLLSGFTGMANGLISLLLIRAIMGVSEGAFCPTSFATTNDASKPARRGLNLGIQQSTFPLFGLALGPILATQLLGVMSWRWIFVLVAVPGLILAVLLAITIREPASLGKTGHVQRAPISDMLKHRNVPLAMLALFCAMAGIFTLSALVPSYLADYLKLSTTEQGLVTSAIGFGGFFGQLVLPGVSDIMGRKLVTVLSFILGAAFVYAFSQSVSPWALFATLLVGCFFCFGLLGLITGPIAAEAAPLGLISSTTGIIVGSGEIFGGGIAPIIAGRVAQSFGIQHTLTMALIALIIGVLVTVFLRETAPRRLAALDAPVSSPSRSEG